MLKIMAMVRASPGARTPLPLSWAQEALEGLLDLEEGGIHLVSLADISFVQCEVSVHCTLCKLCKLRRDN